MNFPKCFGNTKHFTSQCPIINKGPDIKFDTFTTLKSNSMSSLKLCCSKNNILIHGLWISTWKNLVIEILVW